MAGLGSSAIVKARKTPGGRIDGPCARAGKAVTAIIAAMTNATTTNIMMRLISATFLSRRGF